MAGNCVITLLRMYLCFAIMLLSRADKFQVNGYQMDKPKSFLKATSSDDKCTCIVTTPERDRGTCSVDANYKKLSNLYKQLKKVNNQIRQLQRNEIPKKLANLTARLETLDRDFKIKSAKVKGEDFEFLKADVKSLTKLVDKLDLNEGTNTENILTRLEKDVANISSVLDKVRKKNPIAASHSLKKQVKNLLSKIKLCREEMDAKQSSPFPGDRLPVVRNLIKDFCRKKKLVGIGNPVTHTWLDGVRAGSWFKDPLPRNNKSRSAIYYILAQYHTSIQTGNFVYSFENYTDFGDSQRPVTYDAIYFSGTGSVVYNGSLFYVDYESLQVLKFDLGLKKVIGRMRIPVTRDFNYNRGSMTYIDLKVDEYGLWAVYTTDQNQGYLIISHIDAEEMFIRKTWRTNRAKTSISNLFFVCGTMYTMDSSTKRSPRRVQYAFSTDRGKEYYSLISVPSHYGGMYQLTYNPREKMLFAWDNGHLLTYPLKFQ